MLAFLAEPVPIFKFVGRERFTRSGERNQYSLRRESRGSWPDPYAPTNLPHQQEQIPLTLFEISVFTVERLQAGVLAKCISESCRSRFLVAL
jgi:hypothetical protein